MNLREASVRKALLGVFLLCLIIVSSGTAFALADVDFTQCENDTDNSGLFETCKWTSGALNQIHSRYAESDGVPQRLIFKHTSAVANEVHTVTFRYDFTNSNVYGYDFLVDPDHTVPASLLNYCGNLPPFVTLSNCESALAAIFNVPVPSDIFDQVPQREHPPSRNIVMGCFPFSCSATVLSITHSNDLNPGNITGDCFQNCGNSTVDVTVQFSFPSVGTNNLYMWFAGELSPSQDPDGAGPAIGWGTGFGASSYPGASLHMRVVDIDGDVGGARDNALNSNVTEQSHTADLSVTKTCPGTVVKGNNVSYTIHVTNSDTNPAPDGGTATSVYIDDTLPAGVTFVSASISQGTCEAAPVSGIEHCDIGTMQPGDVVTATIVVNVPSGFGGSSITNSVTVEGAVIDPDTGNNTDDCMTTVTTPGLPDTDVSVDKTCPMSDEVAGGDTFDYTITVTNNSGSVDAGSVTLTDSLPGGVTFVSSNPDSTPPVPTCAESGGIVTCDLGPIAHGDHVDVTITVQANASTRGMITNTASVSLENQSNTSSNSSDHCDTNVVGEADLSITKSPCDGTVDAGSQLVYTITVDNDGPSTATNTQVVDTLPSGVTFVSAIESQGTGCTFNMVDTVTCDVGTIAPSGSATITLTVLVNNDATSPITNSANVHSDETDPDTEDNTFDCSNDVNTPTEPGVDLSVEKQCPGSDVTAGNNFSYTVTVTNNTEPDDGSTDATGVTLVDTLPAGVTFVSGTWPMGNNCTESSGTVTCNIGNLGAGESVVVTITVQADPSTRGSITNGVVVSGGQTDPDTDNNTDSCNTNVTGDDDLHITKTDSPDPVITGNQLTYTINVSNGGPSDSTNVVVVDTLPPGTVSFVSASATQGSGCTNNGNVSVTCNLGTINPGGSATITIVVQVNIALALGGSTTITNSATVTSNEDPDDQTDSEDTRVTNPVAVPALTDVGMMIFVILAGLGAAYYLRRQRRENM
jgi:uncharacterized repeat protein (TIGR01451 family)